MGKSNGGTRSGNASSPKGLNANASAVASVSEPAVRQLYNSDWITRGRNENEIRSASLGISVNDASAEKDRDILDSVMGQLSDGMWENSPAMEKYWRTMEFGQDANGNVVLKTVGDYTERKTRWSRGQSYSYNEYKYSGIHHMSDTEKKNWIAGKIRAVVSREQKDYPGIGKWSADNRNVLDYLTRSASNPITVADAYSLYKRLKK